MSIKPGCRVIARNGVDGLESGRPYTVLKVERRPVPHIGLATSAVVSEWPCPNAREFRVRLAMVNLRVSERWPLE